MTYIAKVLNFVDVSGPRPYYAIINKWPQKHILYQFPHYFFTHLNPQIVSKATIDMYKSWENLHMGPRLIFVALDTICGFKWVNKLCPKQT